MDFVTTIKNQVLVIDGAMGTQVQNLDLTDADYGGVEFKMLPDILVFSHPDAIKGIHLAYFRAGANAVETNTFGATPFRLGEYDFSRLDLTAFADNPYNVDLRALSHEDMAYHMSKRAAEIACDARDEYARDPQYDGRPLFVLGSIGPSNRVLSSTDANLKLSTFDEMMDNFHVQVLGLVDGGADVLLYETQQDILELKAAVMGGAKRDERAGQEAAHHRAGDRRPILEDADLQHGYPCRAGHHAGHWHRRLRHQLQHRPGPDGEDGGEALALQPPAHLRDPQCGPARVRRRQDRLQVPAREDGGDTSGSSSTNTASTSSAVVAARRPSTSARSRIRFARCKPKARTPENGLYLSGPQDAVLLDGSKTLIRFGERLNVRGSIKVRDAVENETGIDHDALEEVVREQVEGLGCTVIDVCMDSNQVDTVAAMVEVVHIQTTDFPGAMCLDSFQVDALEESIKQYPGRPLINSISMEEASPGVLEDRRGARCGQPAQSLLRGPVHGPYGSGRHARGKARSRQPDSRSRAGALWRHARPDFHRRERASPSDRNRSKA